MEKKMVKRYQDVVVETKVDFDPEGIRLIDLLYDVPKLIETHGEEGFLTSYREYDPSDPEYVTKYKVVSQRKESDE